LAYRVEATSPAPPTCSVCTRGGGARIQLRCSQLNSAQPLGDGEQPEQRHGRRFGDGPEQALPLPALTTAEHARTKVPGTMSIPNCSTVSLDTAANFCRRASAIFGMGSNTNTRLRSGKRVTNSPASPPMLPPMMRAVVTAWYRGRCLCTVNRMAPTGVLSQKSSSRRSGPAARHTSNGMPCQQNNVRQLEGNSLMALTTAGRVGST
jgi:hypothetical protein